MGVGRESVNINKTILASNSNVGGNGGNGDERGEDVLNMYEVSGSLHAHIKANTTTTNDPVNNQMAMGSGGENSVVICLKMILYPNRLYHCYQSNHTQGLRLALAHQRFVTNIMYDRLSLCRGT